MSENSFMAMIKKNPVTTGVVSFAVLAILIIVIVLARRSNNTPKPATKEGFSFSDTFSLSNITDEDTDGIGLGVGYQNEENEENEYQYNDYENEIVENFPQPAPMNVMYSDANGNLATTNDLGLQNLSVMGSILSNKNLQTNRNRVCFSSAVDDPNHSIYNNGYNIDGEGGWDGMKMNTYLGLDVRTGNASGAVPATRLSVRDTGISVNGNSSVSGDAVVGGKLSINGCGNVKDTLSDIYARIDTLGSKAIALEKDRDLIKTRASALEAERDLIKDKASALESGLARINNILPDANNLKLGNWTFKDGGDELWVWNGGWNGSNYNAFRKRDGALWKHY